MKHIKSIVASLLLLGLSAGTHAAQPETGSPAEAHAFGAERPVSVTAAHLTRSERWELSASAEKIFPLLCPTREYDWIPSWRAKLVHSKSGFAEPDCIFVTRPQNGQEAVWICTRFEPPTRIEYTTYSTEGTLWRLTIQLEPSASGTAVLWTRSWYAVNEAGEAWIRNWNEAAYQRLVARLRSELEHYLRTGHALRSPSQGEPAR